MGLSSSITLINPENIKNVLKNKGFISNEDDFSFYEMEGGVCSRLFWVIRNGESFVLKQPLTYFRGEGHFDTDSEVFFYRNIAEQRYIRYANSITEGDILPKLMIADEKDYFFVMTAAKEGSEKWKDILLRGQVNTSIGTTIGKFVADLQNATANREDTKEQFTNPYLPDPTFAFYFSRIHPCYEAVRDLIPEIATEIQKVIDDSQPRREALCTFDINPKNILVKGDSFMLVDHEGAQYGDPSFDVGMTLAHFMLKAVHNKHIFSRYTELANCFWNGFKDNINVWEMTGFEKRAANHIILMVLSRAFGKLLVDYLTDEDKRIIRTAGINALQSDVETIEDVTKLIEAECKTGGYGE